MTQPPQGDGGPQQPPYPQQYQGQQGQAYPYPPAGASPQYPYPPHQAAPYPPNQPPQNPFGAVYDPAAEYAAKPARGSSGLRPAQIAGLGGVVLLILGLIIGSVIGLVIVIVGAAGVLVGVVDAVRAILAERRET